MFLCRNARNAAGLRLWNLSLVCLCLLTSAVVRAQEPDEPIDQEKLLDLDIEQLMEVDVKSVYGASKYIQKITEAPSSITIITAADIKAYGYRTMGDILSSVRGMFYTYERNYGRVGVRGFIRPGDYNARIQVLIDGHRVNDNVFSGVGIGTDFNIDVGLIQRVEVIRGANASMYGNNAFFGVVNVITKSGEAFKGAEIPLEAGNLSTYAGRMTYGNRTKNGLDFVISGSGFTSAGQKRLYYPEFDDPATNDGIASNVDDDRYAAGFGRMSWKKFKLEGAVSSRTKQIPTGSFDTVFNHPDNKTRDIYAYVFAHYERPIASHTQWVGKIFYDRYDYDGSYIYDNADPGDPPLIVKNIDLATGEWFGVESYSATTIADRFVISAGGEVRHNSLQDQTNYDVNPPFTYLKDHRTSRNWSLYSQNDARIAKWLNLSAGVRYDYHTLFGGTANPRIALICLPNPRTAVKLLYGRAFRAPNVYESFYVGPVDKINLDLEPERIHSGELIWEQGIGPYFQITMAGFLYRIDDLITQIQDPADGLLVYRNIDRIDTHGAEMELEGEAPSGIRGRLSYSYQKSRDVLKSRNLTNSPKHLFRMNLSIPTRITGTLSSIELRYISRRATEAGGQTPPFWSVNATVIRDGILPHVDLAVSVNNVLGRRNWHPGTAEHLQELIEQDGRTARIRLTFRF